MSDPIVRHAEASPDAPALVGPSRTWTYAALRENVEGACAHLRAAGIGKGDRVALHLPRRAGTVVLLWALWRRGSVAVPLSTRLPPPEAGRQARRVGCSLLLTDDAAVAAAAPETLPVRSPDSFGGEETSRGSAPDRSVGRDATILFTSGSTGTPKAVLHSWSNHLYSAKGANANLPLRAGDRWLLTLPLYHVGGLAILVRCALAGAAVVIPASEQALGESLRAHRITHASLVSTQLRRLLAATDAPPSSVRGVLVGGGPVPDSLLTRGRDAGWPLHTSYGCTEMASQITTTEPGAPREDLRTAGRRLPHRRIKIEDGEIYVKGAPLCRGYVTENGLDDPRTEDGWYPTADRGRLDAGGRLHVLGRLDRMFVSGGENIQPEEIESALEALPGVRRAVVVPVPDPEYGRRPAAFVEADGRADAEALRAALADRLPRFKIPDAFHSLPAHEEEEGLKVDRERLAERARLLHE